jgi:small-conductance mechanosensitive channel
VEIAGEEYTVKQIMMMSTDFVGSNNMIMTMSNFCLSQSTIYNYRHSGQAIIDVHFLIAFSTPQKKLDDLLEMTVSYCKQHSDLWLPNVFMSVRNLNGGSVTVVFYVSHRWYREKMLEQNRHFFV